MLQTQKLFYNIGNATILKQDYIIQFTFAALKAIRIAAYIAMIDCLIMILLPMLQNKKSFCNIDKTRINTDFFSMLQNK